VGNAIVKHGGDTWFFVTVDYAPDFSSYLLQAQASKAKIIGLANGGGDTINSIKQAGEFNIVAGGQNLAAIARPRQANGQRGDLQR
jgi:branched-chain amino acid transport system substrate-binding protein